jgi:hypothetical protein
MRDQSETINETEQKRQVLMGFTKYTNAEIDAMSDDEVKNVYHDLFS